MDTTNYHFYNNYHMGDCILSLKFFYNIRDILRDKKICIYFYCNLGYLKQLIKELEYYTCTNVIILISDRPSPHGACDLWMGNNIDEIHYTNWELYFEAHYKKIIKYLQLEDCNIDYSLWQPEEYLLERYKTLPDPCKTIDILVINGITYSGQYHCNMKEINDLCIFLNQSHRIITTRKIEGIPCTIDMDLRIQDIAALATHCKYIIAIHTGPLCALYNKHMKSNIKKWFFIVSDNKSFIHHNIDYDMITDGNLECIHKYFSHTSN